MPTVSSGCGAGRLHPRCMRREEPRGLGVGFNNGLRDPRTQGQLQLLIRCLGGGRRVLRATTEGAAFDVVENVPTGHGLDSWRALQGRRFDPATASRKRKSAGPIQRGQLTPSRLNSLKCFFLVGSFPVKMTKTRKYKLFLLGKLAK